MYNNDTLQVLGKKKMVNSSKPGSEINTPTTAQNPNAVREMLINFTIKIITFMWLKILHKVKK